ICLSNFKPELSVPLLRKEHEKYLLKGLRKLGKGYQSLDASRPWICYWILQALALLDALPEDLNEFVLFNIFIHLSSVIDFLSRCQHKDGGFGGGPGQVPHSAPTYAAINALMICGTEKAYNVINRLI